MNQIELAILDKAAHILAREANTGRYWLATSDFSRVSDEIDRLMEHARPHANSNQSTPYPTPEELLYTLRQISHYWSGRSDQSVQERCDGLVHSILCIFDGVAAGLPALDIFVDGVVINENVMLHELWAKINT